jgi:hypothetical protein
LRPDILNITFKEALRISKVYYELIMIITEIGNYTNIINKHRDEEQERMDGV